MIKQTHPSGPAAQPAKPADDLSRILAELAHLRRVSTVGEMAASLTHELNQPLTAILTNTQAALRILDSHAPDYGEIRRILLDVIADDKRAGDLIRQLRFFLKKKNMELRPLQINDVIAGVQQMLHSEAILREASIELTLDRDLPPALGDEVQLQQVLLNLALNGFDAMAANPPGRRVIRIRTEREGNNQIRVSVADAGPGIRVEPLEQIFIPYFSTKKDGMGIGLAVAYSIIERHQGRLWAENHSGAGAEFLFTLPVHSGPEKVDPV